MLLISTTHQPATDLGYLLHKHPDRIYRANLTFGEVCVAFPEANENRATAALLLDIDSVRLVRGGDKPQGSVGQYVNDRPYAASSFVSVALIEAFSTAMQGRCSGKPELAEQAIPLEIRIPVLRTRLPETMLHELFDPLGYTVEATPLLLDAHFPEWGSSPYYDLTLKGTLRLCDALRHVYILLPVLDASKHYFMDATEVEKLLTKGAGWLADHPRRNWIVRAYLGRKPSLERDALEQLSNVEEQLVAEENAFDEASALPEDLVPERRVSLHTQRHDRVVELVRDLNPKSVVDLGCGDGKLLRKLIPIAGLERIVGMDVSYFDLARARRKLNMDEASPRRRERIQLLHGSLMYKDERLTGFDVGTVVEVVEHLDPPRLAAFERTVFGYARPRHVLLTTPNREYNEVYGIEELRHSDHRFEWTRAEFNDWAQRVAGEFGYEVLIDEIGEVVEPYGAPSLMGVFSR